jgi:mono/diheme cytochrome c family protein
MSRNRFPAIILLAAAGALAPGSPVSSQVATLPGLVEEGKYAPGNLGMQTQPAPRKDDAGAVYAVGPWPTYTPPLAEGKGREVVQSFCGICHSTTYITMQPPLPGATWEAVVHKMIASFGAPIPDAEAQIIVAYLKTHYTPETRRK